MRTLAIAILLAGGVAHAEDRPTAERYFRAGAKAYAAQNFAAAATDFDEAYKAYPLPEIAFSAAQAYRRLYRVEPKYEYVKRSVELYRAYLDKVKTGGRVGDAADNLEDMQRELDKLDKAGVHASAPVAEHTRLGVSVTSSDQADTGTLREIGDAAGSLPKGLRATIDGKPVDPFALVDVDAKEHVLAVSADGYFPAEKKAVAVQGQSQLIELELRPKPARVKVATEDGAQVTVDGRPASALVELPAGKHLIAVSHRGREPFAREVTVTRGQELVVSAPLEKTGRRRAVPYVVGGAGLLAAGAVATGIAALVHDNHASDLLGQIHAGNAAPSVADQYDREVSSRDHYVTATWVLGGAAVAAGAVGAFLYFFDTPSAEGIHVAPVISNSSTGVTLGGRF